MTGCKCSQCFGLAEYQQSHARPTYGLPTAPGCNASRIPLRLVQADDETTRLTVAPACNGSFTCDCDPCQQDRLARVKRGGEGSGRSDPFKGRHAA